MAARKPLVVVNGQVQELPAGDTVNANAAAAIMEPVVVAGGNTDVVYQAGSSPVPSFVTTSDGDVVCATGG